MVDGAVAGGKIAGAVAGTGRVVVVEPVASWARATAASERRRFTYCWAAPTLLSTCPARSVLTRAGSTWSTVTDVRRSTVGWNHSSPPGRPW